MIRPGDNLARLEDYQFTVPDSDSLAKDLRNWARDERDQPLVKRLHVYARFVGGPYKEAYGYPAASFRSPQDFAQEWGTGTETEVTYTDEKESLVELLTEHKLELGFDTKLGLSLSGGTVVSRKAQARSKVGATGRVRVELRVKNSVPPTESGVVHVLHCFRRATYDLYLIRVDALALRLKWWRPRPEPPLSKREKALHWYACRNVETLSPPQPLYRVSFWQRLDFDSVLVKASELDDWERVEHPHDFTVEDAIPPERADRLTPPEVPSLYALAGAATGTQTRTGRVRYSVMRARAAFGKAPPTRD